LDCAAAPVVDIVPEIDVVPVFDVNAPDAVAAGCATPATRPTVNALAAAAAP